eukprot:gene11944-2179_t
MAALCGDGDALPNACGGPGTSPSPSPSPSPDPSLSPKPGPSPRPAPPRFVPQLPVPPTSSPLPPLTANSPVLQPPDGAEPLVQPAPVDPAVSQTATLGVVSQGAQAFTQLAPAANMFPDFPLRPGEVNPIETGHSQTQGTWWVQGPSGEYEQ